VPSEVSRVIDLTAEFPAPRGLRSREGYRCVPMLDAFVPDEGTLFALVKEILEAPGTVLVHCAQGHGRSALVAAVLLARGLCVEPADAEAFIRRARPGARLHPEQRAFLTRLAPRLRALGR
jgi:protein-tyrosine phosphatase